MSFEKALFCHMTLDIDTHCCSATSLLPATHQLLNIWQGRQPLEQRRGDRTLPLETVSYTLQENTNVRLGYQSAPVGR